MNDSKNTMIREQRVNYRNNFQVSADSQGFTLVEIIMVIVLIGILAVSVVPKLWDTSSLSLEGAAAMVAADIRYAQELAMGSYAAKKVEFTQNSNTYTLKNSNESVIKTVELPSGVTVSSSDVTFEFNSLGEPQGCSGTCGTGCCDTVELTAGGSSPPKTVSVDSDTGRVSSS